MPFYRFSDIEENYKQVGFDPSRYFDFSPRIDVGFEVLSVIIVAYPTPLVSLTFMPEGEEKTYHVSPGYYAAHYKGKTISDYLTPLLNKGGYHLAEATKLPCKPVAAHTGLGVYGRNNIIYVEGMGSFCRLAMYLTDLPSENEMFYDKASLQ